MRLDTCFDLPQIRRHLFRGDISRVARLCGVKDTTLHSLLKGNRGVHRQNLKVAWRVLVRRSHMNQDFKYELDDIDTSNSPSFEAFVEAKRYCIENKIVANLITLCKKNRHAILGFLKNDQKTLHKCTYATAHTVVHLHAHEVAFEKWATSQLSDQQSST